MDCVKSALIVVSYVSDFVVLLTKVDTSFPLQEAKQETDATWERKQKTRRVSETWFETSKRRGTGTENRKSQ